MEISITVNNSTWKRLRTTNIALTGYSIYTTVTVPANHGISAIKYVG